MFLATLILILFYCLVEQHQLLRSDTGVTAFQVNRFQLDPDFHIWTMDTNREYYYNWI